MNRPLSIALVAGSVSVALLSLAARQPASSASPARSAQGSPINPIVTTCDTTKPPVPPARVTFAIATGGLPCTFTIGSGPVSLESLQSDFDFNSWLTFVALNSPADGTPIGRDASTVWEGFQDLFSLMLPGGAAPPPFGESVPPPAICTRDGDGEVLQMISKTPATPTVSVAGQPLRTGPLIDQNGRYARYQLLVNKPMYDYIVANRLYSKAGQRKFLDSVAFPKGQVDSGTTRGRIGAIVVKAAWKVLDPKDSNDNPARFHAIRARVYTPASKGVKASCHPATLGLVGLHIVHKTATEPQWIWSTFEHVDNVPDKAELKTLAAGRHYNFFRPGCSATACPVNAQPPRPWDPSVQPFPGGFHSQIARATAYMPFVVKSAGNWNAQFQGVLSSSVWKNYELISTQWPTDATSPIDPTGQPFPLYLANTTMETYVQGNVPSGSSSCMACHGNATTVTGKTSDFSFILERAQ